MRRNGLIAIMLLAFLTPLPASTAVRHFLEIWIHPFTVNAQVGYNLMFSSEDDSGRIDVPSAPNGIIWQVAEEKMMDVKAIEDGGFANPVVTSGQEDLHLSPSYREHFTKSRRDKDHDAFAKPFRTRNHLGLKLALGGGVSGPNSEAYFLEAGVCDRLDISSGISLLGSLSYKSSIRWYYAKMDLLGSFRVADGIFAVAGLSVPLSRIFYYVSEDSRIIDSGLGAVGYEIFDILFAGIELSL